MKKMYLLIICALWCTLNGTAQSIWQQQIDSLKNEARLLEALQMAQGIEAQQGASAQLTESIADLFSEIGDPYRALQEYRKYLSTHGAVPRIVSKSALQLYRLGEYEASCEELLRNFHRGDTTLPDLDLMGRCYDQLLLADSAIHYQRLLLQRAPGNASNVQRIANNFMVIHENDSALLYTFRYLQEHNPHHKGIRYLLGMQYYIKGETPLARLAWQQNYDEGDRTINTVYYLARCEMARDSLLRAKMLLDQADQLAQGTNAWVKVELGNVHQRFMSRDAKRHYEAAEALLQPDSTLTNQINLGLAYAYLHTQENSKALERWLILHQQDPHNTSTLYALATLYARMRNRKNERKYYQLFVSEVELNPTKASQQTREQLQHVKERLQVLAEEEFMSR